MIVKALMDGTIEIKDMHGEPLDGAHMYEKMMPSSIRKKILADCQKDDIPELARIVQIIVNFYDMSEILDNYDEQESRRKNE